MNNNDIIKSFVINKLGCNCPDEVFNIIRWQKDIEINGKIILNYKINIGNRLLIYIIQIDDDKFLNDNFLNIIRFGISERNENSYNRFRLVILSNNFTEIGSIAQNIFNSFNINDQKVHLHFMQKIDIVL
jgi:hypothetical protein